jgi:hypothetical protein
MEIRRCQIKLILRFIQILVTKGVKSVNLPLVIYMAPEKYLHNIVALHLMWVTLV